MAEKMSLKERARAGVRQSVEEAQAASDYREGDFSKYFLVPEGVKVFWPKKGDGKKAKTYYIDLIPFIVGEHFPDKVFNRPPRPGDIWHYLDVHTHKNVGKGKLRVICPKNSFKSGKCFSDEEALKLGKVSTAKENVAGCPICEDMTERQSELPGDENKEKRKKIWKELKPERRCLYNLLVAGDDEIEADELALFEFSHFLFQKSIDSKAEGDSERGGQRIYYADLDADEGRTIKLKVMKTGEDTADYEIDFVARKDDKGKPYEIPEEYVEQALQLDELLTPGLFTYDELKEMYEEGSDKDDSGEEEEEEPRRGKKQDKEEEEPRRGLRRTGRESSEEKEEKEEPRRNLRRGKTEEKTEEESVKEEKEESGGDSCPEGFEFGKDCGGEKACDKCADDLYQKCMMEQRRLKKQEKEGSGGRTLRRGK